MSKKKEIYFSTDIETDGPIPGRNSMLSFGCAAFDEDGKRLSTFSANLHQLAEAEPDASTMEWWKTQPEAWEAHRKDLSHPGTAMKHFVEWVEGISKFFGGKPVFVGYPAGFDFLFVYWYLIAFAGNSPFSFSALDIKSYASALLDLPYRESTKRNMPKRWFGESKHTHVALDDAIEQGELFCKMLKERKEMGLV